MNYRVILCMVLFLAVLAVSDLRADNPAVPPQYRLVPLGGMPGYIQSVATDINNQSQIVGAVGNHGHDYQPVLFDTPNQFLGSLGGRGYTHSINNNGRCVGYSFYNSYNDSDIHPVEFHLGQTPTLLCNLYGSAEAINDNGLIVGYVATGSSLLSEACVFTPDLPDECHSLLPIPQNLPGSYLSSTAMCVNNNDQIGGFLTLDDLNNGYAVLWNPTLDGYVPVTLGGIACGNEGQLRFISDIGQAVGIAGNIPSGQFYATLFDTSGNGNNISLGTINGGNTCAQAINNLGQIVGWEVNGGAILFDSTGSGNNYFLDSLVEDLMGWHLTEAHSVNDNGWIVGVGINPLGQSEAFLLIPEPATLLLFGLGGLALRRRVK